MTKPTLYVGLHGPVLIPSLDEQDTFLGRKIADFAKPFMHWAKEHFDVRWLSETGPRDAIYTSNRLSLPEDAVSVAFFRDSKVENMDPQQDFYWIDHELIPGEAAWLQQHNRTSRFIQVDDQGVTPAHRARLQQLSRRG